MTRTLFQLLAVLALLMLAARLHLRVLDAVSRSPALARVIMGSRDDRMGASWVEQLTARGIDVSVIPGCGNGSPRPIRRSPGRN